MASEFDLRTGLTFHSLISIVTPSDGSQRDHQVGSDLADRFADGSSTELCGNESIPKRHPTLREKPQLHLTLERLFKLTLVGRDLLIIILVISVTVCSIYYINRENQFFELFSQKLQIIGDIVQNNG